MSANTGGGAASSSPEMLKAILDSALDAILTIDDTGLIETANPATSQTFGYALEEMRGRKVEMLMPEPYRSQHAGYISRYLATGEARIIGIGRSVYGERRDGTVFPIHLAVSTFTIEGRRYFTAIIHDLTERVQALSEISRREALLQAIYNHVPDPLMITDLQGRLTLCNPATTRVFGFEAAELTGQPLRMLADGQAEQARVQETMGLVLGSRAPAAFTLNCRRKSGETFPVEAVGAAIHSETSGETVGSLCLMRDVSLETRREEMLREVQRIEALGQLTGGIAHDFNNLLTVISGNLELLDMQLGDAPGRELLKEAEEAAALGASLTNRLLTFARRRQLAPRRINLNDQVEKVLDLLRRTLGAAIELKATCEHKLWPVEVDPGEIENTLLNLAINSRDAMPNGGRLLIETANVELDAGYAAREVGVDPGEYVRLSISDTGHGMSQETLKRAIEPFFTTKAPGRGTGLGLSTIHGFVKQSGGHVTIYSELGHGTTVNLYLPRVATDGPLAASGVAAPRVGEAGGERVLVVEDNAQVRRLTVRRLVELGYSVLEVEDANQALVMLERTPEIDMVLSDLVMPGGLSGHDLARIVRQRWPHLPVLLATGYASEIAQAMTNGDSPPVLRKPYSQAELARKLREVLDRP